MNKRYKSQYICPRCNNKLRYWISDDYYLKGKKFFECEVCGWKPSDSMPLQYTIQQPTIVIQTKGICKWCGSYDCHETHVIC